MYGLVNQGIKDLVTQKFGEETWVSICQEAQSPIDFISMQYYDDAITYSLVKSASKVLQLPPEKILGTFGEHWVKYTAHEGYGPIMDLFGSDFKTCLSNLNNLHTRMGMSMPQLRPPSFLLEELSSTTYILKYSSDRPGLESMVQGLLEGLAKKFKQEVKITLLPKGTASFVEFKIELLGSI